MKTWILLGIFGMVCGVNAQPVFTFPKFANPDIKNKDNFVKIKAGSFKMGSSTSEATAIDNLDDEDLHDVTISRNFEIQATVVTQAQYFGVMGINPSNFNYKLDCSDAILGDNKTPICPNNPVEMVSWNDAQNFISKLNSIDANYSYRLPTEAEWEYTARAGTQTAFWFGNDYGQHEIFGYGWYNQNSGSHTHAVGSMAPNPWGLYDVHGNVWQWVSDWYETHIVSRQTDPIGPRSGTERVLRGGSWASSAEHLRAGNRDHLAPIATHDMNGFRLVRTHK